MNNFEKFLMEQDSLPFNGEAETACNTENESSEPENDSCFDYCSQCSDINDFLKLTDAMVYEINELRAEVVRWRQALIKHLPPDQADGLAQDIFDSIYVNVYEDFDAYNYFVKRCCNGTDPFDNPKRAAFMTRLRKGTDKTSITYL